MRFASPKAGKKFIKKYGETAAAGGRPGVTPIPRPITPAMQKQIANAKTTGSRGTPQDTGLKPGGFKPQMPIYDPKDAKFRSILDKSAQTRAKALNPRGPGPKPAMLGPGKPRPITAGPASPTIPRPPGFGGTRPPGPPNDPRGVTPRPMPRPSTTPKPYRPGLFKDATGGASMDPVTGNIRPPTQRTPSFFELDATTRRSLLSPMGEQNPLSTIPPGGMKKGGAIKSSASKRADGVAKKGKTRGKMV